MVTIEFDNDWNVIDAQDEAHVEVSTDGGSTWTGVWDQVGTDIRDTHESINISSIAASQSNVKIRIRSVQPGWDWWWTVDNFCVYGTYVMNNNIQLTVTVNDGWNMVSVPGINPNGQSLDNWWSGRVGEVYKYVGGYQVISSTTPGEGYWMKHLGTNVYNTGDEWPVGGIQTVTHESLAASSGWNLIGGYELSVLTANITTVPSGLQSGPIYQYSGGYQEATTIEPGYGYWIKLTGAGQIIIPEVLTKGTEPVEFFPEDWGKIILTDATGINYTLYAVKGEVDLNKYELPPAPPSGMFDIRFSSGRIAEDINSSLQTIDMSGVTYPLTVRVEGMDMRLMDETGSTVNVNLKSGEDVVISDATVQKLMVTGEVIPTVYALEQNYPNPFNPSTSIRYTIAEDGFVKLAVYNLLGEEVSILVNTTQKAGRYEVAFNASKLSSGVYVYRIESANFTASKKLILMK